MEVIEKQCDVCGNRYAGGKRRTCSDECMRILQARKRWEGRRKRRYSNDKPGEISISKGFVVLIDVEDDARVRQFLWAAMVSTRAVYARGRVNGVETPMHRFILDAPDDYMVDHINGDGLDNRKQNLRLVTPGGNAMNRRRNNTSTSGFKGVTFYAQSGKWRAVIQRDRKLISLGLFTDKIEAALAYDRAARELFGPYARLNFPNHDEEAA